MHVVTGATGHVGSAVVKRLIAKGEKVLAVTRSLSNVPKLKLAGADVVVADVLDTEKMAEIFSRAETIFLLNPPGDPSKDSVALESETMRALLTAIKKSKTKARIVAESTQGAQPGDAIGDLGVLYELEEGLRKIGLPTRITRAGYYLSNFDMQIASVKETGVLQSFMPADFKLPMAAPEDLGVFNADTMMTTFSGFEIKEASGPKEYSANDVAAEFARIFNRDVRVEVVPREAWIKTFQSIGFSEISAKSFAEMTRLTVDHYREPKDPHRGPTTLGAYLDEKTKTPSLTEKITQPFQL